MSQRPPTSFRNTRKHFVRCVDCGCQTLPQNAPKERPWSAAASLYVASSVNDGALCFSCANKRKALLGLPVEPYSGDLKSECGRPVLAPANESTLKTIRVNEQEYTWNVTTLESLIEKWKEQYFYDEHKKMDGRWWRVVVNDAVISADDFSSVPISDGDEISIVLGRGRYY
jgi:molybdopterin converting factor small subunit